MLGGQTAFGTYLPDVLIYEWHAQCRAALLAAMALAWLWDPQAS